MCSDAVFVGHPFCVRSCGFTSSSFRIVNCVSHSKHVDEHTLTITITFDRRRAINIVNERNLSIMRCIAVCGFCCTYNSGLWRICPSIEKVENPFDTQYRNRTDNNAEYILMMSTRCWFFAGASCILLNCHNHEMTVFAALYWSLCALQIEVVKWKRNNNFAQVHCKNNGQTLFLVATNHFALREIAKTSKYSF